MRQRYTSTYMRKKAQEKEIKQSGAIIKMMAK